MSKEQGAAQLQLNDPVRVTRDNGTPLEGIVAYVGRMHFAESSTDDDTTEWIGVRLTGPSAGLGDNNGTVQGQAYFAEECPVNCGMFVKAGRVEKRHLTRLEALRLKRELATVGSTIVAAGAATPALKRSGIPSSSNSAISTPAKTPATTSIPSSPLASTTTTTDPKNEASAVKARMRLEDIRKRRAALQENSQKESTTDTAVPSRRTTTTKTTTSTEASEKAAPTTRTPLRPVATTSTATELTTLKKEIETLNRQLLEQKQLAQQELQTMQTKYQQQLERLRTELKQATINAAQVVDRSTANDTAELQGQIQTATREIQALQQELERVQQMRASEQEAAIQVQSELSHLKHSLAEQESRNSISTEHYKERAKLHAEISTYKRRVEQLEKEHVELENALEDLTLDKEQLLEEKEILEDRYEELKIDAETAQIQVDELRMELEDAKQITERAVDVEAMGDMDAEDKAQALALQNARFRQALIRVREQSSVEKMELQRQLRDAEKEMAASQAVMTELESLRQLKLRMEDEINELKDMVEQGAAFEGMVEDLSDRVLSLEEDVVQLQSTIRELEEAAELAAEMEEVQADELKAINRDLEGRDTIIRNLEEAIKMQRRREEDMRRTVANYRTTVETLKMEKQTLIDLQEGGEGQQKSLLASSQKALAKAAQLVADAATLRKREAKAVMDKIDHQIYRHLSTRLESLLPQTAAGGEIAAMKGELLTAKVVNKASQSLAAITASFGGSIRPPIPSEGKDHSAFTISDEVKAEVATMFHQTEYALDIVNVSSSLIRFLAAGQWPDLLSPDVSSELGALLSHSMLDLDFILGDVLQSMKQEGALIAEQSNIERLRQATKNTMHQLETELEREEGPLVPTDWSPPGLHLLKEVSLSKFSCLGAAAMLSSVINAEDSTEAALLNEIYNKVEQCGVQASSACLCFASMNITNEPMVSELAALVTSVNKDSSLLLQMVQKVITANGDVKECEASVDSALRSLAQLSAALRAANLHPTEDGSFHPLSPEADDVWDRLTSVLKAVREVDGDGDNINYLIRSRQMESNLTTAVENEPKLSNAESKIAILEKNLSARAKELAMQNARLSELERMLAKSNVAAPRSLATDFKSSQEYNMLMEENRVLMEAMDVLQRQVDEYENEIRSLKDTAKGGGRKGAPRRALTSISDMGSNRSDTNLPSNFSLEASLFRPALQEALRESWKWKAIATANAMAELTPLPMLNNQPSKLNDDSILLNAAIVKSRLQKASVKLIDLTNKEKAPRTQLRELRAVSRAASQQLESVALRLRGNLMQP